MYDIYAPWNYLNNSRPDVQKDTYIFYSQMNIYLGGKPGTERVVLYTTRSRTKAMAQIQKLNESTGKWVIEYQREAEGIPYFSILNGYWQLIQQNVVILYYSVGSGGYLTYIIIGKDKNKVKQLSERKDIFQGSVWFEGAQIVEAYGVRNRIWIIRNGKFALVPYRVPNIPGSAIIEFSINPRGKINIVQTKYKVPAGSIVQVIRSDLNPISERILYSYTPIMKFIPHRNGFKVLDKGKIEFTVIPGGYDWDKSINVTVEAV